MYDTAYTHDSGKDIMPERSTFNWDDVSTNASIEIKGIGEVKMRKVSATDWSGEYRDGGHSVTITIGEFLHAPGAQVSGKIKRSTGTPGETDDMGSFVGTKTD